MSPRAWLGGPLLSLAAVFAPTVHAADKQAIEQAIARGVAHLKQGQGADGSWSHANAAGATALVGLTLLECGVHAGDPAVRRAAVYLRAASLSLTHTYSLALCNMFFDRLGDPGDVPLIESITVRLLYGQSPLGGWTYQCPGLPDGEFRRLSAHVKQQTELVARREPPKGPPPKRTPADLPREIRDQLGRITSLPWGNAGAAALLNRDDNSNTQFAILGLWVSRRHGLPVDPALTRAERHFRGTQNANGGWGYIADRAGPFGTNSTPAMTCAGLLGLALGYGATGEAVLRTDVDRPAAAPAKAAGRNLAADRAVRAGLALLAAAVGQPRGHVRRDLLDPTARAGLDYYFLWSLERVAVAYDLKTIGRRDWYGWGAELLLAFQEPPGSWTGKYPGADTCFALLFLCRSNLVQDLTVALRGKLRDPGVVQLRAGFGDVGDKPKPGEPPARVSATHPPSGLGGAPARPDPNPVAVTPPSVAPAGTADHGHEARQRAEAFVKAPAARQPAALAELVEGKGAVYTEALATAIPQLTGEARQQARDALAKRLARMTAATLRDKFKTDDAEVRRAAALAVELKDERQLIPDLIALLDDAERPVTRAAHAALKEMTRQDIGPTAAAWKAWWAKQK